MSVRGFAMVGLALVMLIACGTSCARRARDADSTEATTAVTGHDFYVRIDPDRRAEVLQSLREIVAERGMVSDQGAYAAIAWHDFEPPQQLLRQLSRDLNLRAIWLTLQNGVDAFEYLHWESGECVRHLAYGCRVAERTWEIVDGDAEPWEGAAFFAPAELERKLESNRSMSGEEEARLRRIWRDHELTVGCDEPSLTARNVAEAVATAHGLPGWK